MLTLPTLYILHLEDSGLDAELEVAELRRAGLRVRTKLVRGRGEFETALREEVFDLILADFKLPEFDGLDALAYARSHAPLTPFIFITGVLGEDIAIQSLRNGATDYVLKMRLDRLGMAVGRAVLEARERTERRRMESELADSESRFRNMADFAPVMIWTANADKSWSYCNRVWLQVTGLSIEQSSGRGWTVLVHALDLTRVLESYDRAFEKHQNFTLDYRLRGADGQYRWIVNHAVPRFSDDGTFIGFIGSCTDVTELKNAEERLRHGAKLESLGILAGGIAHDFNNLLTGIMANASLLADELPADSRAAVCAETILRASETAAQLTRQMLAFSGKGHFFLQSVDLSQSVSETLPLIAASVPRLVDLRLELGVDLPTIEADQGQIQQLVMNLIINAAEAIGAGTAGVVTVSTSIEQIDEASLAAMLSSFPISPGSYVALCVRDNGSGMNPDIKLRMFDPFFTTKFVGRGLGLAAVSGIVRGHRGGITLSSDPGIGTEFRVFFPVHKAAAKVAERLPVKRDFTGTGLILLVDDEAVVLETASLALKKYGYQVITARDGKEAVDLFRERASEIDLVLLDMAMPVMSGGMAFRLIREIRSDVCIVMSSGYDEAEAINRFGGELGAFIQKPYRASYLAEKVKDALSRGRSRSITTASA